MFFPTEAKDSPLAAEPASAPVSPALPPVPPSLVSAPRLPDSTDAVRPGSIRSHVATRPEPSPVDIALGLLERDLDRAVGVLGPPLRAGSSALAPAEHLEGRVLELEQLALELPRAAPRARLALGRALGRLFAALGIERELTLGPGYLALTPPDADRADLDVIMLHLAERLGRAVFAHADVVAAAREAVSTSYVARLESLAQHLTALEAPEAAAFVFRRLTEWTGRPEHALAGEAALVEHYLQSGNVSAAAGFASALGDLSRWLEHRPGRDAAAVRLEITPDGEGMLVACRTHEELVHLGRLAMPEPTARRLERERYARAEASSARRLERERYARAEASSSRGLERERHARAEVSSARGLERMAALREELITRSLLGDTEARLLVRLIDFPPHLGAVRRVRVEREVVDFLCLGRGRGLSSLDRFELAPTVAEAEGSEPVFGEALLGPTHDGAALWHLLGHHFELTRAEIREAARAFVAERSRASAPGFVSPSVSRLSPNGTEVLAAGLERFRSPEAMLELYLSDPEHFLFTLGSLRS